MIRFLDNEYVEELEGLNKMLLYQQLFVARGSSCEPVRLSVWWLISLMKHKLFFAGLLFVFFSLNPNLYAQLPAKRAAALRTLKGCAARPITLGCSEDTAGYLIKLYDRGDHSLLRPLLDAGGSSDGALAEILGDFYSTVLSKTPRLFLASVRLRLPKQQQHLCWMAGVTDGSGMGTQMLRDVRHSLRVISSQRSDPLSSVARICLASVTRANASSGH
jgi:hypothetical protein